MAPKKLELALDFYENYESKVAEAADYVRGKLGSRKPVFGIVFGSGFGDIAESIERITTIPYGAIPNFPITTVPGHEGKMLIGELEDVTVIGLKGRTHYYEVADEPFNNGILQTVFPVHVLADLRIQNYFVTNACGGLNKGYAIGDIMIIRSHINLLPNALLGRQYDFLRVDDARPVLRFQPMGGVYDSELTELLKRAGSALGEHVHEGRFIAVTGPTYETEGESIAFREGFQADAICMSTTPEVIVARNRGMKVVGMSCITNVITADGTNTTNHEEVKSVLESPQVKGRLLTTVREFFRLYRESCGL